MISIVEIGNAYGFYHEGKCIDRTTVVLPHKYLIDRGNFLIKHLGTVEFVKQFGKRFEYYVFNLNTSYVFNPPNIKLSYDDFIFNFNILHYPTHELYKKNLHILSSTSNPYTIFTLNILKNDMCEDIINIIKNILLKMTTYEVIYNNNNKYLTIKN
jgi:hypothetical protein